MKKEHWLAVPAAGAFLATVYSFAKLTNEKKQLEIEAKNARAESEAKSRFLSYMSHDIRTPINGIMGMTEIALKNRDNREKVEDCLHKIEGSSKHLLSLINDVLDLSSIEKGKTMIYEKPMDIRKIIEHCTIIMSGGWQEKKIHFVTMSDTFSYPYVMGDELHLQQILINILGNAVKYTPEGGNVTFKISELSKAEEMVTYRFDITDTGIGMTAEFLAHIWDSFAQEETSQSAQAKGNGLGMAITKQLVDLMDGDIFIESKPNVGSRFVVDIPFLINHTVKETKQETEKVNVTGMRVLLVEDNDLNMEIAKYVMEDEGILVTEAKNGQKAVELYQNSDINEFDVILMDIVMPVMNGLEAAKRIRTLPREDAKTIPILAMTAHAYEKDVEKTRASGMNGHLAKPIDARKVLELLSKYNTH